jgi:hypothetical protein
MTTETKLIHDPVTHGYDPRDPKVLAAQTDFNITLALATSRGNPTADDQKRINDALIAQARAMRRGNAA